MMIDPPHRRSAYHLVRVRRWVPIFAAALFLFVPASGCGPGSVAELSDDSEAGGSPARAELRVAFTRHLTMAPVFITEAEGFFDEQRIDVELVGIQSPATAMPALLQGRLDVLPGALSPAFFNAVTRGGRVRLVADKGAFDSRKCAHQAFVVSTASLERDPGHTALGRVGTAKEPFFQFFVERALIARGLDPADSEMFHVPQAAEYDALRAGRLDAAMVGEPWLTRIKKNGGGVVGSSTNELMDGYQYSVYLFGPRLLDEDPELGKRVAVALLKGVRAYNEGKTARNLEILGEALGHDPDELREICWPPMRRDGLVVAAGIRDFQEWAFSRGYLDAITVHEDYWDPRFVEHAWRVLDGER